MIEPRRLDLSLLERAHGRLRHALEARHKTSSSASGRDQVNKAEAKQLGIEPRHFEIVTTLLRQHVPGPPVWAFGSRSFGRAHHYSDLGLAVGGPAPLGWGVRMDLMDAFDQSLLPIEVDVVDLNDVHPSFRSRIEPDFLEVQPPAQGQSEHYP